MTTIINNYGGAPNPIQGEASRLNGESTECCGASDVKSAGSVAPSNGVAKTSSPGTESGKDKGSKESSASEGKGGGNFLSDIMGFMANLSGGAASPLGGLFGLVSKALGGGSGDADTGKKALPKSDTSTIA
jgi:hypothetical protein